MTTLAHSKVYNTSRLCLRGGILVTPLETRCTDLTIAHGLIIEMGEQATVEQAKSLDVRGCYVTPGLIDLQVNGGPQCNFWAEPNQAQVANLGNDLLRAGVTSICPTLITDDLKHLVKNRDFFKALGAGQLIAPDRQKGQSLLESLLRLPGIHLEGPCLSAEKPGVHPLQHLKPLSVDIWQKLLDPTVKLVTLAPELEPSGDSLAYLKERGVVVALGHSNATYEQAKVAFDRGVTMVTHTFNALPTLHHRAPGAVVAALLDDRVTCAIIADGLHVNPACIQLVLKVKGVDKTILVTDAAQVGTTGGGLVGSSITLNQAVQNLVRWGIATFEEAIKMATWNPAQMLGWQSQIGHIALGKIADLTIWNAESLEVKHVIAGGEIVF